MTRKVATALCIVLLSGFGLADDTLWTRNYQYGSQNIGQLVRCSGSESYVCAAISEVGTMYCMVLNYDDGGTIRWNRYINYHGYDYPAAMAISQDGYPIVATVAGTGQQFCYLAKFNGSGDTVWTRAITGGVPKAMTVDPWGNVFVLGLRGQATDSFWLLKCDGYGNPQWSRGYRIYSSQTPYGIDADDAGNLYAAFQVIDGGDKPMFCKFNNAGDLLWTKLPGNVGSAMFGVSTRPNGDCYFITATRIAKYDSSGAQAWVVSAPSRAAKDICSDDGGCYVAYADGSSDIHLKKLNPRGQQVKDTRTVLTTLDSPMSLDVAGNGKASVAGIALQGSTQLAVTIRYAAIPGIALDPDPLVPRVRAATTIIEGNAVRWSVTAPGVYRFRLNDAAGRTAAPDFSLSLAAGSHRLTLPPVRDGIYYLRVAGPDGTSSSRLLKVGSR